MKHLQRIALICIPVLAGACATTRPPASVLAAAPSQWEAPLPANLPHDGKLTDLTQWWRNRGDPVLTRLIDAAEAVSPTITSAGSRIAQARATRTATGAALLPTLDAAVSVSRSSMQPPLPMGTTTQGALQPTWEIDVFGGNRAARDAAQARLEGAQASWHDARVSVAAEVANTYFDLRACRQSLAIVESDARSRGETARLTDLSAQAGFQAPATAALAHASAAEGSARVSQQRASCELGIKALVALTALPEPELRQALDGSPVVEPMPIVLSALPADTLAQRPDVYAAQSEVAAASADTGAAEAQRYPRLTLSGSIGAANFRAGGEDTRLTTWSIGPLSLSAPLFDGGRRAANAEAARARYEEAVQSYRASVRRAVREVEEALVNLESTAARGENARAAVEGYRASFESTQSRYQNGLASLVELEDSRRTRLAAELSLVSLERERRAAWVALYRAAGGGWKRAEAGTQPAAAMAN